MNIIETIDRWAEKSPLAAAHISDGRITTYHNLVEHSDWIAAHLAGILKDDHAPVMVRGHKENEMLVAFLGIVKSGHPYIPVDNNLPEKRVEAIREISQSPLILTVDDIKEIIAKQAAVKPARVRRKINPEDPWYILFTSGSTGDPKGVVLTTGCLDTYLEWTLAEQQFKEGGEVFLNQAPFTFDMSVLDIYCAWTTGGAVFSLTKDNLNDPPTMYKALYESGITVWHSTPSFAQMCLIEPGLSTANIPCLRKIIFLGETLSPETAADMQARFPEAKVWNTYGPTEATVATSSVLVDRAVLEKYSPLPIGYPTTGCRTIILNPQGHQLPAEERGEIIIVGPNVSPGYLGRPDLTAKAFFTYQGQPAYHTGDLGYIRDGLLFYVGRMDNQIKLHGYRIELGDIEANLRDLEAVQDAVVLPLMKNGVAESLAAFIILKTELPGSDFEKTRTLKKALNQHLPAYMVPRRFTFMDKFPMNNNGKADRKKLAETLA